MSSASAVASSNSVWFRFKDGTIFKLGLRVAIVSCDMQGRVLAQVSLAAAAGLHKKRASTSFRVLSRHYKRLEKLYKEGRR